MERGWNLQASCRGSPPSRVAVEYRREKMEEARGEEGGYLLAQYELRYGGFRRGLGEWGCTSQCLRRKGGDCGRLTRFG